MRVSPALLGSFLVVIAVSAAAQTTWSQKEFILGTFWDPPADARARNFVKDSTSFRRARDAHFNLLTGTQDYYNIERNPEGMRWILRCARATGLRYLVTDDRFFPVYDHPFREALAESVLAPYLRLPATLRSALYGYDLADEPQYRPAHRQAVREWKRFIERVEPGKLVYYNLVSSYGPNYNWGGFATGNYDAVLDLREKVEYDSYLRGYIDELNPAVVSFDHYPFFRDGSVRADYFYNLEAIRTAAGPRPFWAYVMSVDHLVYVDPLETHLRFMYFSPLAYGAKGLIVFTYAQPNIRDYREAIVDRHGRPTKKYPIVRRLNAYVSKVVAPVIMNKPFVSVHHASAFPGQQDVDPFREADSQVLAGISDAHLCVGIFGGGKEYFLLVVNKSLEEVSDARLMLKATRAIMSMAPSVRTFRETARVTYAPLPITTDRVTGRRAVSLPSLAGGEGRMFRLSVTR
jgi:hypothetical protein